MLCIDHTSIKKILQTFADNAYCLVEENYLSSYEVTAETLFKNIWTQSREAK